MHSNSVRHRRRRGYSNPTILERWFSGHSSSRRSEKAASRLSFERLEDRLALTVVINEFLAENDSGIEDIAGHNHDWIELKNTGGSTENISGWYLTDDSGDLTKFQIPDAGALTVLDPGEILLIYASGNNGEVGLVGSELHTNFQLSQEPGYLGLVLANGTTIEHEFDLYPQQIPDVSFGLGVSVSSTTSETLITTGSAAKYRVFNGPDSTAPFVDDVWTDIDYTAPGGDGWINTTTGVGWDNDGGGVYTGLIPNPITPFSSPDVSAYIRVPFTVTNKADLVSMNLELIADDAYILYLNGREVKRERLNTTLKSGEDWELNARRNFSDADIAGQYKAFIDLTDWLDTIEEGANMLAIYGANHTSQTGDFLIHPVLTAERANGAAVDSFMVTPTPGTENGAGYDGLVDDTSFSIDRGFYEDEDVINLDITTDTVGATIRYTLDGTRPTLTNGITYSGAISLDPSLSYTDSGVVTIRAAAFKTNYLSTNVDTQTYIFLDELFTDQDETGLPPYTNWGHDGPDAGSDLDPDWDVDQSDVGASLKDDMQAIPTVSLVMDWAELFGTPPGSADPGGSEDNDGIYTQRSSWRNKSDQRQASVEFFTSDGLEEFQVDSIVEIQGHSSTTRWNNDKLSFEIKFKQPLDTRLDSDTLFKNSVSDGANAATKFDSLILDAHHNFTFTHGNVAQNGYARFINDQVVSDFINEAGGTSPHGRWVHLYINGLYWGIYNLHERPTDSFAAEYFGGDKDDYYSVKAQDGIAMTHGGTHPEYSAVDGGLAAENAYDELLSAVGANMSVLANYQNVAENYLDIDSFIDYMIIHYYAGNWDWGQDNWFATFNFVDPNGLWRFHAWDQEHAFNTTDSPDGNDQNSDYTGKNDTSGPTGIHVDLMASAEYKLRFSDRVQELMRNDGLLTPSKAVQVWNARVDELSAAINGEVARWGDNRQNRTTQTWLDSVQDAVDDWFPNRTDTSIDQFQDRSWLVSQAAPLFNQYGGEVSSGFDLTITNPGSGTIYYTIDGSDPRLAGGAVNTLHIEASGVGPLTLMNITESTRVRARVLNGGNWSAEVDKAFVVDEDPLFGLRIVELMYNPAGSGDTEYIEILNTGTETVDLTGVRLTEFSAGGYTFTGGTLDPGERIVVVQDQAAFALVPEYASVTNIAPGDFSGSLANEGEAVALRLPTAGPGDLIQLFTYDDNAPWPTSPDGDGYSLIYIGPFDANEDPNDVSPDDPYDDPTNWVASANLMGSPGAAEPSESFPPGDYDQSGTVDDLDFDKWKSQYGMTVTPFTESDGNGDGRVSAADYTVWRDHYGASNEGSGSGAVVAATLQSSPSPVVDEQNDEIVEDSQPGSLAFSVSVEPGTMHAKPHHRLRKEFNHSESTHQRKQELLLKARHIGDHIEKAFESKLSWLRQHHEDKIDEMSSEQESELCSRIWEDRDWLSDRFFGLRG